MKKSVKIIIGMCFLFAFISYAYQDALATQRHGIEVWNALIDGRIKDYYNYCLEHTSCAAAYDFSLYFIFALWNLPIWIIERIFNINAQNYSLVIIYGKVIVLIAYIFCIKILKRIYNMIGDTTISMDEKYSPTFFFSVSLLLTTYSLYTGNYDILSMTFILYGIYNLLIDKKILFIVLFAVAISMKYFAFWVYIPLILLYEKNIWKIGRDVFLGCSVSLIEKCIFNNDVALKASGVDSLVYSNAIAEVLHSGRSSVFGVGDISLCIVAYAFLCIYCYFLIPDKSREFFYKSFYVCAVAWFIFFTFFQYNSYWIVLLVPFLTGLVFSNRKRFAINIIFEMLFSISMYLSMNIRQWWIVGYPFGDSKAGLLEEMIKRYDTVANDNRFYSLGEKLYLINFSQDILLVLNSICIVAACVLLYINRPQSKVEFYCQKQTENLLYSVRNVINVLVLIMPSVIYIWQLI